LSRTENIAKFVKNLTFEKLPPEVVKAGKNIIMDTLGCGVGTTVEDKWKDETAQKIARHFGGTPESVTLISGLKLPSAWAAFVNGVLCHGIDFDDTHKEALTHTGAPIVPSALAVAEATGASGKDLILAAVIGYEISVRVGMCVMPSHYKFWHSTATNCTFGGAALTAKLYGCDEAGITNALGLAGTEAAGLLTYLEFGDFSKSFNPGKTAFNGVMAGVAAYLGATAPPTMLEHERGYSYAYCFEAPKLEKLDADLGVKYEILENVPKPWPSLLASHPPIEAVLFLLKKHGIKAGDIAKITERTYNTVKSHFSNYDPKTTMAARLSVPYCIAVAAATGDADLAAFTMPVIESREVRSMLEKVEIIADPELNSMYPQKFPAVVTIDTKDGKSYKHEVYYPKGDVKNPFTTEEFEGKFKLLVSPALGEKRASEIVGACNELDQVKDVREFARLFVK
jgi:2-methylcitrate dehydratase PrpD